MSLPRVSRTIGFGLDLGGTTYKTKYTNSGQVAAGSSLKFNSVEDLLTATFRNHRITPAFCVLAIPGERRSGWVGPTNLEWPATNEGKLGAGFGTRFQIINDMQAAGLGAMFIQASDLKVVQLKDGSPEEGRHIQVVTLSTGVNLSTGSHDESDRLPYAREGGHIRPALEMDSSLPVVKFVEFVSRVSGRPASWEDVLGGGRGINYLVEFLRREHSNHGARFPAFEPEDQAALAELREKKEGPGRLMSEGALADNPFWIYAAKIYGEALGFLLHATVTSELVGDLFIQGSVLNGTPGFAHWLMEHTRLEELLLSRKMEKPHLTRNVRIMAVPNEAGMAARGAAAYAHSKL